MPILKLDLSKMPIIPSPTFQVIINKIEQLANDNKNAW